jgi:histone H3/H4
MNESDSAYKRCSTCKSPIEYGAEHYLCSVSTCNRPKLGLFFCSLPCWEAHVPEARHRDAWAEQHKAPTRAESASAASEQQSTPGRARVIVTSVAHQASKHEEPESDDDVLVVVSKLKRYIRSRSEMNTSDTVVAPLSNHLRQLCNEAIRNAARDGRKTVFDRDFAPLLGKKPG